MRTHLSILTTGLIVLLAACSKPTPLAAHNFTTEPLGADSHRVEIVTLDTITRAECIALADNYRKRAGAAGQVSVRVPIASLDGETAPWCVDNLDGKGVTFNSHISDLLSSSSPG